MSDELRETLANVQKYANINLQGFKELGELAKVSIPNVGDRIALM